MTVAGIRTFVLGLNVVVFALIRDRRATGLATLLTVVVPIADGVIAWRHSKTPWRTAMAFHWGPAILAIYLTYSLLVVWCVYFSMSIIVIANCCCCEPDLADVCGVLNGKGTNNYATLGSIAEALLKVQMR